jgi:hypothetical protein
MDEQTFSWPDYDTPAKIFNWLHNDLKIPIGITTDPYESAADFEQRILCGLARVGKSIECLYTRITGQLVIRITP